MRERQQRVIVRATAIVEAICFFFEMERALKGKVDPNLRALHQEFRFEHKKRKKSFQQWQVHHSAIMATIALRTQFWV
jgi:hypothetical protein